MKDWEERLAAQGVSSEKIEDAKRTADHMAKAVESLAFSPEDPLAPDEFPLILVSRARGPKAP